MSVRMGVGAGVASKHCYKHTHACRTSAGRVPHLESAIPWHHSPSRRPSVPGWSFQTGLHLIQQQSNSRQGLPKEKSLALGQFSREFGRYAHRSIMGRASAQDCTGVVDRSITF